MRKMGRMGKAPTIDRLRRKPAKSDIAARPSSVLDHRYNPETKHLVVTFRGGRQYRYQDVDQATADALGKAESKGSFLNSSILGRFKTDPI